MTTTTPVAIAAVSELTPGRYPAFNDHQMFQQVLRRLLSEWPLKPTDINGLLAAPAGMASGRGADIFIHEALCEELGIQPTLADTMNAGGATYGIMVQRAAAAIRAGLTDSVLCIGAGTFPNIGSGGAEASAKMAGHQNFDALYGIFIPPLYAQAATRHMHEFGTTKEQMAKVAVASRQWAMKNPDALMRPKGEISVPEVLNSKPIASPFNLLDCSVPCDGGGAILVCDQYVAQRVNAKPAWVLGFGECHTHFNISQSRDLINMGGKTAGEAAYRMAGITPSEIDVLELYDSFSFNPLLNVENLGIVPKGQGGKFWDEMRGAPGGDKPVNTYGGLLSFGHTGDASGMSMIIEAARQIMGHADERQVKDATTALAHSYGGMMSDHSAIILGSRP